MLKALLMLVAVSLQSPAGSVSELGIVAGSIAPSTDVRIYQPVRVILLSPPYAALWTADVQKRLDSYWERYKPAFAQRKEFFFEVSKMAYRDSLEYVLTRMQRDQQIQISKFMQTSTPDGRFDFKDLPVGEYKVVAVGKLGDEDMVWQESVDVTGPVPQFVRLKKVIP